MKTWVVVASAARARVFEIEGRKKPLKELFDLVHPEERLYRRDLKTDKHGRAYDRVGGQRHTVETPVDPKEKENIDFARQLLDRLDRERYAHHFENMYLVSPPHFLGLLRDNMSDGLARTVQGTLIKDLTKQDAASVQDHLVHLH